MPVYTVHVDRAGADRASAIEHMILIPDKFNVWAFLFGPVWLLARGIWLGFAGWVLLAALIAILYWLAGLSGAAATLIYWSSCLFVGLEASSLRRFRLARMGYVQVDVATGRNIEQAERSFLNRQERLRVSEAAPAIHGPAQAPARNDWDEVQIGGLFASGGRP